MSEYGTILSNILDEHPHVKIDKDSRAITINNSDVLVKGDINSSSKTFEIARYYDGVDLSEKTIQIIYKREDGDGDVVDVTNVETTDDGALTFTWIPNEHALYCGGSLTFCVAFTSIDSDGTKYALRTKTGVFNVDGDTLDENEAVNPSQSWMLTIEGKIAALESGGSGTSGEVDLSDYYTKLEVDEKLTNLSNSDATEVDLSNYYTKTDVDSKLSEIDSSVSAIYDTSGFAKTSIEVVIDMKVGYNIGNQFDSCIRAEAYTIPDGVKDSVRFYETLWGNPAVSELYVKALASFGITAIRMPVTWYSMYDVNNSEVSKLFLDRVQEVVDQIIQNGMYCIINMHHDGYNGFSGKKLVFDEEHRKESTQYLSGVWKQIAERFKDYGYKLLFEGFNEVSDSSKSMTANETRTAETKLMNQVFIDTVRSCGGNNDKRFLVCPGYAGLSLFDVTTLIDSATDKLIATNHNYPETAAGATGAVTDASSFSKSKGVGVIIDEIGCQPPTNYDNEFTKNIRTAVDSTNVATFWWDNGQREFSMISRFNYEPMTEALANYTGKVITLPKYSYPMNSNYMPYVAKFYTEDSDGLWGGKYLAICSQKPITSIDVATKNTAKGYYSFTGMEGGMIAVYTSDDGVTYNLVETRIATAFSNAKWGCFTVYGSTANTYLEDSNYTISNVPVKPVSCTGITLDNTSLTFTDSATKTLTVTVEPSNTTEAITWTSSDSTIAKVDNGVITPRSNGECVVTVTCGEQSAECAITISGIAEASNIFYGSKVVDGLGEVELTYSNFVLLYTQNNSRYYLFESNDPLYFDSTGTIINYKAPCRVWRTEVSGMEFAVSTDTPTASDKYSYGPNNSTFVASNVDIYSDSALSTVLYEANY